MTAAIAAGWYDSISDAATMKKVARVYGPNVDMADHYAERFARFSASYKRLKSWYRDA
jgi:sugar (pentulose or hexulose) kinase